MGPTAWVVLLVSSISILALLGLGYRISSRLLYPSSRPATRTPADCGLPYEEVVFQSSDGLALKGWWIPARPAVIQKRQSPAVILLHPLFGNRAGFNSVHQPWPHLFHTKCDLLTAASTFAHAGYSVLLFDFRCHGESPRSRCAGGLIEDQDVMGAVDYVFTRLAVDGPVGAAQETPQVGVLGYGMGAVAAITAVGREKGSAETIRVFSGDSEGGAGWQEFKPANVKRLRFLVAVQPASLRCLLQGSLRRVSPLLSLVMVPLLDRMLLWRGGYPLERSLLLKFAKEVRIPVLYIQPRPDPWGGCAEVQNLYDAAPGPKEILWIDGSCGQVETDETISNHLESMLRFAEKCLTSPL